NSSYAYVGIIAKPSGNDTAVLQDKSSKELMNKQRGELLANRFQVKSISEREIVVIDTTLKIRWPIPFTTDSSISPGSRPRIRVSDEEPWRISDCELRIADFRDGKNKSVFGFTGRVFRQL